MKTVLANGCFDLFHYGHLAHLRAARKLGDRLIVALTRDRFVKKGVGRPVFVEYQRAAILRSLRDVDEVFLTANTMEALESIRPDIFVKGSEYRGNIEPEHQAFCDAHGIEIAFTDELTYSSTELLRYYESRRG